MKDPKLPPLFSFREAARRLETTADRLRYLIRSRKWTPVRVDGRIVVPESSFRELRALLRDVKETKPRTIRV